MQRDIYQEPTTRKGSKEFLAAQLEPPISRISGLCLPTRSGLGPGSRHRQPMTVSTDVSDTGSLSLSESVCGWQQTPGRAWDALQGRHGCHFSGGSCCTGTSAATSAVWAAAKPGWRPQRRGAVQCRVPPMIDTCIHAGCLHQTLAASHCRIHSATLNQLLGTAPTAH